MDGSIIGRDEELAAIRAFLDSLGEGPAALVLAGEAGIGKTTLWRAGVAAARERGVRVLTASPAETEAKLSFTALADLLDGVLEKVLPHLPASQARALRVALLLADTGGAPPDPRAIAVAFVNAAHALAANGPVLLAVDDVQWLDAPSASVLEFAARRLHGERLGLLLSQRVGVVHVVPLALDRALPSDRLASVPVRALSLGALHRLLHARLGAALPRPLLQRVHELSEGNPFFALEIGRALREGAMQISPAEPLAVPAALFELVQGRLAALPPETQEALQIAAALAPPTLAVVARAAPAGAGALDAAVDAEVIEVEGGEIRFVHPLLASAAYAALRPVRRRELHRRLADLVEDPEGRARHLALATDGIDREVADELERAAAHAGRRGAPESAGELCEHALRLTPPEAAEAHRRRLSASRYYFESGFAARSRALADQALASAGPGRERAEALHWLARLDAYDHDLNHALERYRQALAEVGDDAALRSEIEEGLAFSLFLLLKSSRRRRSTAGWPAPSPSRRAIRSCGRALRRRP